MSTQRITPVILSGGQGTRLWPLSRADMPKQFIPLTGDKSLFEETIERCENNKLFKHPIVICSQSHRFLIKELLGGERIEKTQIIMEPCGRNTAAAIAACALAIDTNDIILIMPSDHFIPDKNAFSKDIESALTLAEQGNIVTFGITPTTAHTGFGYIQRGTETGNGFNIKAFHEKPNKEKAEEYLANSGYYWNAGIFMAKAQSFIEELEKYASDILEQTETAWNARHNDLGDTLINPEAFEKVRSESIDYAVAEKTDRAVVVPTTFDWNDLGQWKSLWSISDKSENQNATQGTIYTHDVQNSYLRSEDNIVLGAVGLDNIVAIAMKDAVFIAGKDRSEDIKHLVAEMKNSKQMQLQENPFTMRPWGSYEVMDEKPWFKVKKLTINPGSKLSLQKHEHRSEHWVVVKGVATVTIDDKVLNVQSNESVYVPCGTVHRLENKQNEPLEIIEVQTGSYLGEDDIIRFEDDYNRLRAV